jgi:hypothetical protein
MMGWLLVKDGMDNGEPMRFYAAAPRANAPRGLRGRWSYTCQRPAAKVFETRAEAERIKKTKMSGNPKLWKVVNADEPPPPTACAV